MLRLILGFPVRPSSIAALASAALLACANEVSPEEATARPEATGQSQAAVSSQPAASSPATWFYAELESTSNDSDALAVAIIEDQKKGGYAVKAFFCAGSDATRKTHTRWFLGRLSYELAHNRDYPNRPQTPYFANLATADGLWATTVDFVFSSTEDWSVTMYDADRGDGVPVTRSKVPFITPEPDQKPGLYEGGTTAHVGFIYGPSSWGTGDKSRGRGAAIFRNVNLNPIESVTPIGWAPIDPSAPPKIIVNFPGSGAENGQQLPRATAPVIAAP